MVLARRFSTLSTAPLLAFSLGAGLALTVEACSGGPDDPSNALGLGGGSGTGSSCSIVNLANANIGKSACGSNSLGSKAYGSSCTGNGGSPEYWCADFAKWAWGSNGVDVGGLTAAASSFYSYGKAHGTLSNTPHVGDAIVFKNGTGSIHHVAIVTQVYPNGTIESVSGDWGGSHGSEAHFATTSSVKLNAPAYSGQVGTKPSVMGMTIAGYISPYGMSKGTASGCGLDAGLNDSSVPNDAATSTEGGAGGGEGGVDEGGSSEGGDSDGGLSSEGGSEGGYAFFERAESPRRRTIDLAAGAHEAVSFSWRSAPGLAPPADLWVEAGGRPALQISSVGDAPFIRAGLDVVSLRPAEDYTLVFGSEAGQSSVDLLDGSNQALLHARLDGARSADVVLPPTFWRSAIVIESDP